MKELLPQIKKWVSEKKPFAIARVIQTWGSSPRPVGSAIIISSDMEMAGSVSGGCVEGAILKEAVQIIENKNGKRLSYGVTDDEAWSVGLTCGGKIQVYLQVYPIEGNHAEVWKKLVASLTENSQCILITSLVDGESKNTLIDHQDTVIGSPQSEILLAKAREAFVKRTSESVMIGETEYFMQVFPRRSQLLIIGAAHITSDLVQLAKLHDFETIVIDPRGTFAHQTQFVEAPDQIFEKYPTEVLRDFTLDASSYAVILSHDPKIDDNALQILLHSKVAYIGALGSRKTHEKRMERLKQSGFSEEEIKRIEAPIGVDIKAQGAREIALSIMASIIRAKNIYL
ncbi:MAG: XdhC family protein [Bacteroidia bacterium]|nr:XdhC family protein [Bacteroidia bacterium]